MARRRRWESEDLRLRALGQFRLGVRLAREDLTALAERLDDSPPWLDGEASVEWKRAAGLYADARVAVRDAASVPDVLAAHATLCAARFHLARAEALGYDADPPTSSEPCWFDARHGPGTVEAVWQGTPVRACADDAERMAAGLAPRRRTVYLASFPDPADSPIQRRMALQARGAGGYALGALYSGSPHPAPI